MFDLPTAVDINGVEWPIRTDYRAVLTVCTALSDPDLTDQEKTLATLQIMYPDWQTLTEPQAAIDAAMRFINMDEAPEKEPRPALVDWEHDFRIIAPAVNRVLGTECRTAEYMHWWTFIGAYYEIGECLFASVVNVRAKKAKHKKLEKYEREFYHENRARVDMPRKVSTADQALIDEFIGR